MDKLWDTIDEAIADISDGSSILVGGFGESGFPHDLVAGLQRKAPDDLLLIHNGATFGSLIIDRHVRRLICSYPIGPSSVDVIPALKEGATELEIIPQGTFVERIRAGGAGLGGILTPVGVDLEDERSKEIVEVDGQSFVLERPIRADFALIRGEVADRWGNVRCRLGGRNFNPTMATAADVTIVQVDRCVEAGELDPESIHIPGPFVDRILLTGA